MSIFLFIFAFYIYFFAVLLYNTNIKNSSPKTATTTELTK